MTNLTDKILLYTDEIENVDDIYWQEVFTDYGCQEVSKALHTLLNSGDYSEVSAATLWFADSLRDPALTESHEGFRESVSGSGIIERLEFLLESPDYDIRRDACKSLGAICSRKSINHMRTVFENVKEEDPRLLLHLGSEIRWLDYEGFFPWYRDVVISIESKLSKWACLDALDRQYSASDQKYVAELLDHLASDSDPWTASCAKYLSVRQTYYAAKDQEEKNSIRKESRRLELEGALLFSQVDVYYSAHLRDSVDDVYSLDSLDKYVSTHLFQ